MQTFQSYATAERITFFLARERCKLVAKHKAGKESLKPSAMELQLLSMMPARDSWLRPSLKNRQNHDRRWCNTSGIIRRIAKDRKADSAATPGTAYLAALDAFVAGIRDRIARSESVSFEPFSTTALFKKLSGRKVVYRPISRITSLEDKIIITLASSYIMWLFNGCLHEEILSYRPARRYHGSKRFVVTNQMMAISNVMDFRSRHEDSPIWAAECDIQKFYDIVNHDVVMECFDSLATENNLDCAYRSVRPFLKAYLDAYNFHDSVWSLNADEGFWQSRRTRFKHGALLRDGKFCFEWVGREAFTDPQSGCYTTKEYEDNLRNIGIPQGGGLSPVISDVVMNSVDRAVVDPSDTQRLFNRYGDDIILLHTDPDRCHELIEAYRKALREHRFIYHPFEDFSTYKKGDAIRRSYWNAKSKDAFLWGDGEGAASQWIGFVGYEMHRSGAVRLRRSTLDKKFGQIASAYRKIKGSSSIEFGDDDSAYRQWLTSKLEHLNESVANCTVLTENRFAFAQMASLDRYRHRRIYKLRKLFAQKHGRRFSDILWTRASGSYGFVNRYRELFKKKCN